MTRTILGPALVGLILATPALGQGDPQAGRSAAGACAACHGRDGIAMAPDAPNLAGQPEGYLAAQLLAYQSGARAHEQMSLIAEPLTAQEIADLSAYYAAIEVTATMPDELR